MKATETDCSWRQCFRQDPAYLSIIEQDQACAMAQRSPGKVQWCFTPHVGKLSVYREYFTQLIISGLLLYPKHKVYSDHAFHAFIHLHF